MEDFIPHEWFSNVTAANDIGLVRLRKPMKLSAMQPFSKILMMANFMNNIGKQKSKNDYL